MKTAEALSRRTRGFVVPEKILVATDLDDLEYLMPHAAAQARACGAALTLAHVIPPGEALPLDASAIPYLDVSALRSAAMQVLDPAAQPLRDSGIPCDVMVVEGHPSDQIRTLAHQTGAGRILAGTHGRRHLKRFFLGSVAHDILRAADVPVCTIGPHAHTASSFGAPRRILHPVSLCGAYEDSARIAIELAEFYRADITLLHVLGKDTQHQQDADRIVEWTKSELKRLVPAEAPLWTRAAVKVEVGDVVEEVLSAAAEMSADLIVLGVNKDATFWPIRGDDTVYDIIANAKSPVLTFRRFPKHGE
jgi:nucleotide-binding universal stress UspA family protein